MVAIRSVQRPGPLRFGVVDGGWISRHDDKFDESIAPNPLLRELVHNDSVSRVLVGLHERTSCYQLSIYHQPRRRSDGLPDDTYTTERLFDEDHNSVHKSFHAVEY